LNWINTRFQISSTLGSSASRHSTPRHVPHDRTQHGIAICSIAQPCGSCPHSARRCN
jgi:hypothetical protein